MALKKETATIRKATQLQEDSKDWIGQKNWDKRLSDFAEGFLQGMSLKDSAIYAGVNEASAYTVGSRLYRSTLFQQFLTEVFEAEVDDHRTNMTASIRTLKQIMVNPKTPDEMKVQLAQYLLSFYKDNPAIIQVEVDRIKEDSPTNTHKPIQNLLDRFNNPVPVRTIEEIDNIPDEDIEGVDTVDD